MYIFSFGEQILPDYGICDRVFLQYDVAHEIKMCIELGYPSKPLA